MPIFNKISDLFKSKVYVDSGPLEQNSHKTQQKAYSDMPHNQGTTHRSNYKNKDNNTDESAETLSKNQKENFEKYEDETIKQIKYPNINHLSSTNPLNRGDITDNIKIEFNVNKIQF